uniref:Uncharacterized protein n=1 Tax=Branchiostoma floridae TaxID=7739 RepID=C3YKS9_BRAFL|eukprot:XP_002603136.1 hypothetical protein BRAFLDRAFT_63231 [Branchiostoma floridae]
MWRRWRHLLMFLLIILKEPNMPEADCSCRPFSRCSCLNRGLSSIPQTLPTSIITLDFRVCVFVLIGSIVLICYKRMRSQSPLQQSHNVIVSNTNTAVSVQTSSHDNQYEDIDSHHDQPVQGQSRANTQSLKVGSFSHTKVLSALKPNPMYGDAGTLQKDPASTNNHDQTGQDQSQTNTQSLRVGNLSHAEVLAALKPNVMYAGVVTPQKDPQSASDHNQYEDIDNHHDQTGQGQSQAITESDTNAAATVTISGHSLTQDRPITESLDTKRPQCNTLTDFPNSKLNTLYKVAGQYQTITKSDTNTTDAVVTRGHDHQYEDMIQDKKVEQGPSQTITKSNTNATDAEVTSGRVHQCEDMNKHNQIDQGQSHAKTESLDARNFTYGSGPSASQLNSLYAN